MEMGCGSRRTQIRATHPDHSWLMQPVADSLGRATAELYRTAPPKSPTCIWASSTTGEVVTADDVASPDFTQHWATHARQPVDFPRAMDSLLCQCASSGVGPLQLVEMGEGMLVRFCRDLPSVTESARACSYYSS